MREEIVFKNFDNTTCTSKSHSNLFEDNPTIVRTAWWSDEDTQLEKGFQNN